MEGVGVEAEEEAALVGVGDGSQVGEEGSFLLVGVAGLGAGGTAEEKVAGDIVVGVEEESAVDAAVDECRKVLEGGVGVGTEVNFLGGEGVGDGDVDMALGLEDAGEDAVEVLARLLAVGAQ